MGSEVLDRGSIPDGVVNGRDVKGGICPPKPRGQEAGRC